MVRWFGPTMAAVAGLAAFPVLAQPVQPVPAANPPAIQRLAEGTLPIAACPGDAERGCIEILFDGPAPPVPCWTLPPFGASTVRVETGPPQPAAEGSTTWRMVIRFHPLREVPPATPATLQFGFARPGAPLVCDQALVVQRPAGVLDLPAQLDLGVLHVEAFGHVSGGRLVQPVFPAPGQPAIGPITLSARAYLHAADRRGGPVPVRLDLPTDATVTASRFAELALSPDAAPSFPALGALSGQAWLTAPQLVQPLALTIRASSQIGWISILAMLALGIAAGALVNRAILPRQALARARLEAERAMIAAARLRDREKDEGVVRDLDQLIGQQRQDASAATDAAAVAQGVQQANGAIAARLEAADARRQALAAAIAPARAALQTLPAMSDLPAPPLDAWSDALDQAQAMIEAGEIERPARLIDTAVAERARAAQSALDDFATRAAAALRDLDRWTRDPAVKAFAPLKEVAPQFALPPDAGPVQMLAALRDAQHALRRTAAVHHSAIATVLRGLAAGAANAKFPQAADRTEAILADLDRKPVAALTQLAALVRDYDAHARAQGGTSFEALADIRKGLESGPVPVPPVERRIALPEEPALALETQPRLPVAEQAVTIRLLGLDAGRTARIWTPFGSARIGKGADPVLTIQPAHPGLVPVDVVTADDAGHVLSRQSLTLTVRPAADHTLPVLTAAVRRSDRLALLAAAVLALLSGAAVFSVVPLTSWWGLLAPLLWGFFVKLNLPEVIAGLQSRRDAVFKTLNIG